VILAVQQNERVLSFLLLDHDFSQIATVLQSQDLVLVNVIIQVLVLDHAYPFGVEDVD
jgi:hypothetical protein